MHVADSFFAGQLTVVRGSSCEVLHFADALTCCQRRVADTGYLPRHVHM